MSKRRYVYREVSPGKVESFEVGGDYSDAPRSTGDLGKFEYNNLQATDGTPIDSRTKRREYMKRNNITDASDFKGTWEAAEKERTAFRQGHHDGKAIRETIERAAYESERKRRNGR